ncbi:MAG: hypothetical protein ISS79_08865 [Phycisphaerae bacterium]|nr:hypothetical protein [Phycisphaerae bacterium]
MRPAENIKRLVKNARIQIDPEVKTSALKEIINELERSKITGLADPKVNILRMIMKSKITKLTVAAIFIIAIIGLHQFNSSIRGTSIVWADVAERLEKVSSYKAQSSYVFNEVGKEESVIKGDGFEYFSPDHGYMEKSYWDGELGMLIYGLFSEKSVLIVFPQNKQYYRFELNEEILAMIEYMNPANTGGIMKLFGSERCIELGSREVDGKIAEGFEVKDVRVFSRVPRILFQLENIDIRLWVNNETLLPIKVELEGLVGKGLLTMFKDFRGKRVMYNIEYDAEIDESIFDPNIPDDYKLIDPGNIAEKAEIVMLGILPFSAVMVTYKHFKEKIRNRISIAGSG